MELQLSTYQRYFIGAILFFISLIRFISLGCYPLADPTEARYAEIARLMVETGNWITPQISRGIPFWGKPPLSTWASALSMKIFGFNEFAARLPSFLFAFAIIILVWHLASRQRGKDYALIVITVLFTSFLFLISSGAVMTDLAMFMGTTLSMVAFWQAMHTKGSACRIWGYYFFIGMAVGLLAKGPVALVLAGGPIGLWVLWQRKWIPAWHCLPWIKGLILTMALAMPWYWLAEIKTPGFLQYFIIGEHWQRFMVPGWKGDLYGHAHNKIYGTIWLYWLGSTCPWSLIFFGSLLQKKGRRQFMKHLSLHNPWISYLFLWAIFPMIFFTMAGNILWTYVLPGLPAFALIMTEFWLAQSRQIVFRDSRETTLPRFIPWTAAAMTMLFFLSLILLNLKIVPAGKCQKELVRTYQKLQDTDNGQLIYFYKEPSSAKFYSHGTVILVKKNNKIKEFTNNGQIDYYAVRQKKLAFLPAFIKSRTINIGKFSRYCLLRDKEDKPALLPDETSATNRLQVIK